MKPVRFSVKTFLIGVAVLAAAFGALESNSELVASLVFTVNLALISFALLGALVARGNARGFWTGFLVFGGMYSLVAFGFLFPKQPNYGYIWFGYSQTNERPQLITSRLLDLYGTLRAPSRSVGDKVSAPWSGGGYWPATIINYQQGRYLVQWQDPSPPEWVSGGQLQPIARDLERVGHSVFSLLVGFLGGLAALVFFGQHSTPTAGTTESTTRVASDAAKGGAEMG
jgi:hypothetical protein